MYLILNFYKNGIINYIYFVDILFFFFQLIDRFMPDMKAKNHGHIVALTSVAGLSYIKDQIPLSVAQFAVQGLAESLMEDLRMNKIDGVHVTLIHIYPFIVSDDNTDLRLR